MMVTSCGRMARRSHGMRSRRSDDGFFAAIMKTTDAFDPAVDFPRHASSSPIVVEWEARMKAFQTPAPEAEQGEWWSPVERVFDLSAQLASAGARAGYRVPEG